MKELLVIGGGGHGRVVADCAEEIGSWRRIAFLDSRFPGQHSSGRWPLVGDDTAWRGLSPDEVELLVAVGDNRTRLRLQQEIAEAGFESPVLVHPAAWCSAGASIGPGSVVLAGAVVGTGARLGAAVIVNTAASVDHDCRLDSGVHVSPGAHLGGGVAVGSCSWIGIGAAVRHAVTVGAHVMVGAGAAVVADVPDGDVVVGVPAKRVGHE